MATLPEPVEGLLEAALVGELTVVDVDRPPGHLPADPALRRRAHLPDLVDAVHTQARAHQGEPEGRAVDHRSRRRRRPDRPGDDPGRRPGHRGGPARRLGAAPPDLGEEGAVDRLLPEGSGSPCRSSSSGRSSRSRRGERCTGPTATRRRAPRGRPPSGRRPRDGATTADRTRARPRSTSAQGLEKLATYPYRDPHLRRRRRLSGQRRGRRRRSTPPPARRRSPRRPG